MSKVAILREIIKVYKKHGWTVRRLLLTEQLQAEAAAITSELIAQNVALETAEMDAVWFSRLAGGARQAWELRLVHTTPYALFETFDKNATEAELRRVQQKMEERLKASKQQSSLPLKQ